MIIIIIIISIIIINIIVIIIMIVESTWFFFPKVPLAHFFQQFLLHRICFWKLPTLFPQTSSKNNSHSLTKKYSRKNVTNKLINGKKALLNRFYLLDHQGACSRRVPEPL